MASRCSEGNQSEVLRHTQKSRGSKLKRLESLGDLVTNSVSPSVFRDSYSKLKWKQGAVENEIQK